MDGITLLEYIGIFAFAISGANVAIEEELDLLGIYFLGFVTAIGGGIIRDIVTVDGIPVFFHSYSSIVVILIAVTLSIILKGKWKGYRLLVIIDAVGLGAFVVSSGVKSIDHNYNLFLFLFVTSITGVGGGLLRDIITNRKPVVFHSEIYCVAGFIGAVVLRTMYPYVVHTFAEYFSLAIIVIIRIVCYSKKINLPKVNCLYHKTNPK